MTKFNRGYEAYQNRINMQRRQSVIAFIILSENENCIRRTLPKVRTKKAWFIVHNNKKLLRSYI